MSDFKFGDKVRFKSGQKVHQDYKNKDFCLLAWCESSVTLIEWEKRGQTNFSYISAKINSVMEIVK